MGARKVSLARGRPPNAKRSTSTLSSTTTRTIIRSHHQLQKARAKALQENDEVKAAAIARQIEESGGLKAYQQASITGQSSSRGGDSSRLLMDWLKDEGISVQTCGSMKLRLLEVGALSTKNCCSKSSLFDVTRIDLNAQEAGIEQQDFMERPLPESASEAFDIISLSLVLNYVPDAVGRGEMLRRLRSFLRPTMVSEQKTSKVLPALFFVLPEPCVNNSRYLTLDHLQEIMVNLGYVKLKDKTTAKLWYSLWRMQPNPQSRQTFKKTELLGGAKRNNFAITMQ